MLVFTAIPSIATAEVDSDAAADTTVFAPYIGAGFYNGGEASGIGYSVGLTLKKSNTLYTLRDIWFFDYLEIVGECSVEVATELDPVCEDDKKIATINEIALLYGKKWKALGISGGVGYLNGKNVGMRFSDDKNDFKAIGFAYSVVWYRLIGWIYADIEASGNVNSENSFFYVSARWTFGRL